jgi:G:T/U-mismatch repair DNA glycosylase
MGETEQQYVRHKFSDFRINPETRTIIIGTFNPDTPTNKATFFYGTGRNYLWRILARAYNCTEIPSTRDAREQFLVLHRIGFIDLIAEVAVPEEQANNRDDRYIDARVVRWTDVVGELCKLASLERACFSRKTLSGIPNIKARIEDVQSHLRADVHFRCLVSPARYFSEAKGNEWKDFLFSGGRN